jgi:proteasome lid subunit RPN8/RPN11
MINIRQDLIKRIVEHAKQEFPNEACGILSGKGGRVEKVYQMSNIDKSPETFFMDPKEQLKTIKQMRSEGLEMAAIYHSHPNVRPYPSSHDVELAFYPDSYYVIVSIINGMPEVRAFKIVNGVIREEEIKVEH